MPRGDAINFRKLEISDLPLMHRWLNSSQVIGWYGNKTITLEEVASKYLPRINSEEPVFPFIIECNNIDIGYIQAYVLEDYPEFNQFVGADEHATGIDLFIGENEFIHKGWGEYILLSFLKQYAFNLFDSVCCIIDPEPQNKVAIRAYEKTGFKYFRTICDQNEGKDAYLMRIYKTEVESI